MNWKNFADIEGGIFIEGHYGMSDQVLFRYKASEIVFDSYTIYAKAAKQTVTRVYSIIDSKENYFLKIKKRNWLTPISKLLGAGYIDSLSVSFDRQFLIQTNNKYLILKILNPEILNKILDSRLENLFIVNTKGLFQEELPEGKLNLVLFLEDEEIEIQQLKRIRTLFESLLDKLELM